MNFAQHLEPHSYGFALDKWKQLQRFLILGTQGGTYYASERDITRANVDVLKACCAEDAQRAVALIVYISDRGFAPKNDAALFALAYACQHTDVTAALRHVARTASHLFQFVSYARALRGWGRRLKRAVAAWYTGQSFDRLAFQLEKYPQRYGYSHADLLRLTHPVTPDAKNELFRIALGRKPKEPQALHEAVTACKRATTPQEVIALVTAYNLPREVIPTQLLFSAAVWEALLEGMPLHAMLRNLGKMTAVGLLSPFGEAFKRVEAKLANPIYIQKSRLHPITIFCAQQQYRHGSGNQGQLTWVPEGRVVAALEQAFYSAFDNVTPSNKNIMMCLDVSGSMGQGTCGGMPITPRELTGALAMVALRTEPNVLVSCFASQFCRLALHKFMSLAEITRLISGLPFGHTNIALPLEVAAQNHLPMDAFVVYTDNEVNAGAHPCRAMARYRASSGRKDAKLVVQAFTSTGFTVADPSDPNMLDVVGFSPDTPAVVSNFIRGEV